MVFLVIFLVCVFVALGLGILAALSDVRGLVIPNSYSVYVAGAFVAAYCLSVYPGGVRGVFDPLSLHILSMALTFLITFLFFALKMIGAADSKFMTACALWVGVRDLPLFLFYTTLCGGILGLAALFLQRARPFKAPVSGGWVEQVQNGENKVPYGVAIAFGMLFTFIKVGYLGSDMVLFLTQSGHGAG